MTLSEDRTLGLTDRKSGAVMNEAAAFLSQELKFCILCRKMTLVRGMLMKLSLLLQNVIFRQICGSCDICVSDIIYDSRKMVPGAVFVCLVGANVDGHDFIEDVVEGGAAAVVVQQGSPWNGQNPGEFREKKVQKGSWKEEDKVTIIEVENTREALGEMSRAFFDFPERKMTLIGITGTKGKTTAATMLRAVLEEAGINTGIMGTTGVSTGKQEFPACNTTPESYLVQKYLSMMAKDGCQAAVMEVSSQGLMCGRVTGVHFDYGIFTNIYPDHIGPGEHRDFDDYIYWKGRLFTQCSVGIVNGMDENVKKALLGHTCALETFGSDNCDWWVENIQVCRADKKDPKPWGLGVRFKVCAAGRDLPDAQTFTLGVPGRYNVMNALPVIAAARHMGISGAVIERALADVRISGRCEVLGEYHEGHFIIDYAHNGKSLETMLQTLREYQPHRLICIFGCGGNRSVLRRTQMARAALHCADVLIITTDNPRYEAPSAIIHDIVSEIEKNLKEEPEICGHVTYYVVEDRREAIAFGLQLMEPGDIVVLAGKGHEDYQEIRGKKYPFDEHRIVREQICLMCKKG